MISVIKKGKENLFSLPFFMFEYVVKIEKMVYDCIYVMMFYRLCLKIGGTYED